jgi:hypothetical protein
MRNDSSETSKWILIDWWKMWNIVSYDISFMSLDKVLQAKLFKK